MRVYIVELLVKSQASSRRYVERASEGGEHHAHSLLVDTALLRKIGSSHQSRKAPRNTVMIRAVWIK